MEENKGYIKKVVRIGSFYRLVINSMKLSIMLLNGFFMCTFVTRLFVGNRMQLAIDLFVMAIVTAVGYGICKFAERCVSVSLYSYINSTLDLSLQEELEMALVNLNYTTN